MIALTTLKPFYQIGYLWKPENQRARELRWVPFDEFSGGSWFGPLFEYAGNTAFFIPFGMLVFSLCRSIKSTAAWGCGLSLVLEVCQYVFTLGRTDIDDLLFNTLGALIGAAFARLCGERLFPVWRWLALAAAAVFLVLVILGPRLGDPNAVVDL
ncbi:VanZ family protein [Corynebacterium tuberculostearicum]|uniref:VanZ family protein n=1 Tax=Corynebacterium TaxID=1716 RepID=UPI001EF22B21|nr:MULTISPECIES: VanZ family protein [Corynebacterium]MCG7461113.1 VanZ family protein [Corynebacterium sp. ACRPF]MDV2417230.1 VanZ family protein [Corynebacterium tuberculostearicum]